MQRTVLFYVMVFFIVMAIFSCLMPYPIFSNYTNLTEKNAYEINNYNETEMENQTKQEPKILDLDWFESINVLLPLEEEYEILDIKTDQSFYVVRTGGKNHADVETVEEKDSNLLHEIFDNEWNWERRPVLVKINENAYLPASLSGYPHGYSTSQQSVLNGHFCLHFKGSKTHGTNQTDDKHQNTINYAKDKGYKLLKNQ